MAEKYRGFLNGKKRPVFFGKTPRILIYRLRMMETGVSGGRDAVVLMVFTVGDRQGSRKRCITGLL
jgi:hypothetical protein